MPGVVSVTVGYANGGTPEPSYEAVCTGKTGHVEAVQVSYDPDLVSYEALLQVFLAKHDPTQKDRQGNDKGTQYRSGVYTHTDAQLEAARKALAEAGARLPAGKRIESDCEPLRVYYLAEAYHQEYLARGGRAGNAQSPAKSCTDPVRCYG